MIHATDVNVVAADDGTKALAIDLVLLVPLNPEFLPELAQQLLGLEVEPNTEQVQEDTHEQ